MTFNNLMFITADIHYKEEQFDIIDKAFIELINKAKNKKPKFVIISGDYFNNRLNADSFAYKTAINRLLELKKYSQYLIVIKGTHSHDNDMLEILKEFNKLDNNIIYIDKFTISNIENYKFAFIPEEYPKDFNNYYKELFNNSFDFIIGHGMLEGAKIHENPINKFIKDLKWNTKQLQKLAKYVIFGHIHIHQQLENNVFYTGSLARYKFGEEEDKGFIEINLENMQYKFNIINNPLFLTYYEDKDDIEIYKELVKDKNVYLRYIGNKNNEEFNILVKNTINPIKFVLSKNNKQELNSEILYKNIIDKSIEEQYIEIIEQLPRLTKKQKQLLLPEKIKKIITNNL